METTKKSKKLLIIFIIIAIILILTAVLYFTIIKKDKPEIQTPEDLYNLTYDFDADFTSMFSISRSNDFIYLSPMTGGLFEYDILKEKVVELPEISQQSGDFYTPMITNPQLYDGKVFVTSWYMSNAAGGDCPTNFMLVDANSGSVEEIYSVPEKHGAQCGVISDEGDLFYMSNLFGDNNVRNAPQHLDDNGYDIAYSLVRYNINSKQETVLVNGVNRYRITGDRIYFDRVKYSDNSVRLYYITFEDAEKGNPPTDTGVDVAKNFLGYMWTVKDGIVYYADDTGSLKSYDPESKKTEEIFRSEYGVRTFKFWGDKIVFFSRFPDKFDVYRSQISIYDTKTKTEKMVCSEKLKDDPGFDPINSENPFSFVAYDDMDYFIMETHQKSGCGSRYYKVFADGTKEQFYESGWEYNPQEDEVA